MSYAPENGAGERSRTVVSALARPHSADRKSTRLNFSHLVISYAGFCLKKKICGGRVFVARLLFALRGSVPTALPSRIPPTWVTCRDVPVVRFLDAAGAVCWGVSGAQEW